MVAGNIEEFQIADLRLQIYPNLQSQICNLKFTNGSGKSCVSCRAYVPEGVPRGKGQRGQAVGC